MGSCSDSANEGSLRRLDDLEYERVYAHLIGSSPTAQLSMRPTDTIEGYPAPTVLPNLEGVWANANEAARDPRWFPMHAACLAMDFDTTCVGQFIESFGAAAYRRPLREAELESLLDTYLWAGGGDTGLQSIVLAVLMSPYHLFHVELGRDEDAGTGRLARLTRWEVGSRLAFMVTGTGPSEDLRTTLATSDLWSDDAEEIARELLAGPRAERGVTRFAALWMGYDNLVLRGSDESLVSAMRAETDRFVSHVLFVGDGSVRSLLTSPYSFLDDEMATHYGVRPAAMEGGRVELDPERFSSFITHASVLARQTTSGRGARIMNRLLCRDIPPPPEDVAFEDPDVTPDATGRENLVEYTADAECAGCHAFIDPVGFAFGGFDYLGRPRTHDGGRPIDTRGSLDGQPFDGPVELAALLADNPDLGRCTTMQAMRYALRRTIEPDGADGCSFEEVRSVFETSDGHLPSVLSAVAGSAAFLHRNPVPVRPASPEYREPAPLDRTVAEASYLIDALPPGDASVLEHYREGLRRIDM